MRRGKYFGWLAVLAIMALPCLVSRVWAAQFSAELVINGPGQSGVFELQVRDDLYRLRKVKGFPMVPPFPFIVDRSTGLTWGLNPQLRQYMEISDPAKTALMNPLVGWALTRRGYSEQPGPAETVNGYQCRTAIYREQGKSEIAAKAWFSDHLNHLVREERFGQNENPVMELKQIKEGPQAPDLFKIPAGYAKMEASGTSASKAKPSSRNPAPASPSKDESGTNGDIVFILDASGSMWGKLEGQSKIAIAKKVMSELIRNLPDDSNVGLVAYGHRRRGDCNDVEELVPLGPIDKKRLISTVQALSPKGKTPISRSIRLTAERLKHLEDQVTIILVSDGKETCDEDPCALVKSLKETSINFVMHVIGFNVTKDELAQLRCLAEAGGGVYYTAKSAKDFQVAAKEVVKKASEKPPVRLKVTCLKDENKIKAYVQILTQGGKKRVAEGWSDPERPALFRLPPGTYDVRAQDQSVIEQPTVELKNVEVVEGRITEVIANFAAEGILQVKAVKNDAPLKAYVRIHRQQDDKYMKDGWTGADGKPAQYKLLPGLYKVKVQDPSVIQRPVVVIENVEVKAGQTVERTAGFVPGRSSPGQGGEERRAVEGLRPDIPSTGRQVHERRVDRRRRQARAIQASARPLQSQGPGPERDSESRGRHRERGGKGRADCGEGGRLCRGRSPPGQGGEERRAVEGLCPDTPSAGRQVSQRRVDE